MAYLNIHFTRKNTPVTADALVGLGGDVTWKLRTTDILYLFLNKEWTLLTFFNAWKYIFLKGLTVLRKMVKAHANVHPLPLTRNRLPKTCPTQTAAVTREFKCAPPMLVDLVPLSGSVIVVTCCKTWPIAAWMNIWWRTTTSLSRKG